MSKLLSASGFKKKTRRKLIFLLTFTESFLYDFVFVGSSLIHFFVLYI